MLRGDGQGRRVAAAQRLGKPVIAQLDYLDAEIPPTAKIEGIDLVTEGVITMSRVVEYAKDYLEENQKYSQWGYKRDGASLISRMLFEEATDINFFVGRAINPAHQNPNLPITFNIKMQLVESLCDCLKKMGNRVKVSVRFRGREMAHTDIGKDLLDKFAEQCAETANLDKGAKLEGRMMSIFLSPKSGK